MLQINNALLTDGFIVFCYLSTRVLQPVYRDIIIIIIIND